MAKKNKPIIKPVNKPVMAGKKPNAPGNLFPWFLGILALLVSVSFSLKTQVPTVDIKWFYVEFGAGLLTLVWLITRNIQKSWNWISHPIHLPLVLFIIITLFAELHPANSSYLWINWIQFFSLILLYLLVSQTVRSEKGIRIVIHGLLLGGVIASIYGIIQKLGLDPVHWKVDSDTGNLVSMLGNSNLFGWFLSFLVPLSFALLFHPFENSFEKWLNRVYFLFLIIGISIARNRAGTVAVVGSVLILFWMVLRKESKSEKSVFSDNIKKHIQWIYSYRRWIQSGILILLLIGMVGFWHKYSSRSDVAIKGRFLHWQTSIRMILSSPALGIGPGNYLVEYLGYQSNVLNDPRNASYQRISLEVQSINAAYAHNEFIQAMVDTGILGFAAFLLLVLAILFVGGTQFFYIKEKKIFWLYAGMYTSLISGLISACFGFPLHVPGSGLQFWVILGLMVAIQHLDAPGNKLIIWKKSLMNNPLSSFCKTPAFIITLTALFLVYGYWSLSKSLDTYYSSIFIRQARVFAENDEDFPQATAIIQQAIRLSPENGLAHYFQGSYYARMNKNDEAIAEYQKAQKSYDDIHIYFNLGQIYFNKKDYKKAEEYYIKTLNLNSTIYQAYRQLGYIYAMIDKNPDMAVANLNKFLEFEPNGKDSDNIRLAIKELNAQIISTSTKNQKGTL